MFFGEMTPGKILVSLFRKLGTGLAKELHTTACCRKSSEYRNIPLAEPKVGKIVEVFNFENAHSDVQKL
jgi:hypothetical protein